MHLNKVQSINNCKITIFCSIFFSSISYVFFDYFVIIGFAMQKYGILLKTIIEVPFASIYNLLSRIVGGNTYGKFICI